jgi:hypothetical protein
MTPGQFKIAENLARRMAERQGMTLSKSRRRDPRAIDYGNYTLTGPKRNTIHANASSSAAALAKVFEVLTADA